MTAAEQARADVEAWWEEYVVHHEYIVTDYDGRNECFADLIARLTPVYERAQRVDEADHACSEALRERAERAEATCEEWKRRIEVDHVPRHRLQAAEADVARLREALLRTPRFISETHGLCWCSQGRYDYVKRGVYDHGADCLAAREALAPPERKP